MREGEIKEPIRITHLPVGGILVPLPCYFPSISSVKTTLSVYEYLRLIKSVNHPLFLISAYDVYHCTKSDSKKIRNILKELFKNRVAILLDSGHYEKYWKEKKHLGITNKWTSSKFQSILSSSYYHLAFCFDIKPNKLVELIVNDIENRVLTNQDESSKGTIVPIIHVRKDQLYKLPEVAYGVAERLKPVMIAVPERELGEGLLARAETILKIRKALNKTGQYYPLHLLGTGNPLSILIFALCGADSFDGLEWCQTTVNHETSILYHFQQRELFGNQSIFCTMNDLPYNQATLAHNLIFFVGWMDKIQKSIASGTLKQDIENYFPKPFWERFKEKLSEVL